MGYTMITLINAVASQEEELARWYDNEHFGDILESPGFVSANRYRLATKQPSGAAPTWQYLTIYTLDTDDLDAALKEMECRIESGVIVFDSSLDAESMFFGLFEPASHDQHDGA